MLKLGNSLSHRVAVYVPSTMEGNAKTDNRQYVQDTLRDMSLLFGGATAQNAMGAWLSENVGLILEDITIIYSFVPAISETTIDNVLSIANRIKTSMNQEAVSVQVDSELYLV